jgi:hypothetical protein
MKIHLHDGPHTEAWLKPRASDKPESVRDTRVDWTFTVYSANFASLGREKPDLTPRLDVYITGSRIDWSHIAVPTAIKVIDDRGPTTRPTIQPAARPLRSADDDRPMNRR